MKHVRMFANAAAIQTALNSRETTSPYVGLNQALNELDWNSLRATFSGGAAKLGTVGRSFNGGGAEDMHTSALNGDLADKDYIENNILRKK